MSHKGAWIARFPSLGLQEGTMSQKGAWIARFPYQGQGL